VSVKALVVGLGQIGMGYDFDLDPARHVLTHARAFRQHPACELVGGVDSDAVRRRSFEERYGAPALADVGEAMRALTPDVVAIATPTPAHEAAVRAVLDAGAPAAILCEKPLAYDVAAARAIVAACRQKGCTLLVNYIRRCEPGAEEVRRRLEAGEIAGPVKGVVWYSKGLFNNGSHFLDLLECWLGEASEIQVRRVGRKWEGADPEPDIDVSFARGQASFLALREEDFSHYTVELLAPNGRLRYEQGGQVITWQGVAADPAYPKYAVLDSRAESIPTDFTRTQWHVVDGLVARLSGRPAPICTGAEALRLVEFLSNGGLRYEHSGS
jgi:predicted dehydrogenase